MFTSRPLPLGRKKAVRGWLTAVVSIALIGIVGLAAWGVVTLAQDETATPASQKPMMTLRRRRQALSRGRSQPIDATPPPVPKREPAVSQFVQL